MSDLDTPPVHPPPPPPKKLERPKITLQIPSPTTPSSRGPTTANTVYWGPTKFQGRPPGTPASHVSGPQTMNPYFNPFMHMYHNKASDFMFKQFEGFKDFTMNTAKSGLSAGEKSAFWFYNKLRLLSKKWFTHFFLFLCLLLYSVMGAAIFMALEGPTEEKYDKALTDIRSELTRHIKDIMVNKHYVRKETNEDFVLDIDHLLEQYENNFTEFSKHINNNNTHKKTWGFWNSMFFAGTIYTTIGM